MGYFGHKFHIDLRNSKNNSFHVDQRFSPQVGGTKSQIQSCPRRSNFPMKNIFSTHSMFVSEAMAQSAQQPVSATTIFSFGTLDIPLRSVLIRLWKETQRGMKGFKPTG